MILENPDRSQHLDCAGRRSHRLLHCLVQCRYQRLVHKHVYRHERRVHLDNEVCLALLYRQGPISLLQFVDYLHVYG